MEGFTSIARSLAPSPLFVAVLSQNILASSSSSTLLPFVASRSLCWISCNAAFASFAFEIKSKSQVSICLMILSTSARFWTSSVFQTS
jgi:hypothetical protein